MKFVDFKLDKTGDGLLPVIVQDATTLKVLMLGYMNEEAYEKTVATGLVTFWSRSRQTLWTKGETSNNFLHVTPTRCSSWRAPTARPATAAPPPA